MHTIEIDGNKTEVTNSVVVLGIHIDNKLTFDDYMFMQLNEIGRLKRYLGKK